MSFLNALASGGLSVGLRIANTRLNESQTAVRRAEDVSVSASDIQAAEAAAAKKQPPQVQVQSPEERAAGQAAASSLLASGGYLGQIQATAEKSATDEEPEAPEKEDGQGEEKPSAGGGKELSEEEKKQIQELQRRDREVKAHEQAHIAAAAGRAGAPSYEYESGPDGKRYAVGGEVSLRSGGGSSDPEAAIAEAEIIKRAATAPAEPSSTDRAVAAQASADISRLKTEKAAQDREEEKQEEPSDDSAASSGEAEKKAGPAYNGETMARQVLGAYKAIKFGFEQSAPRPSLALA